ncbi:MAG: GDP-mannose 4,6-dehydratase [Enterocloster bolteae]
MYRPAEVEFLWGDPSKAERSLIWKRKVDFKVTCFHDDERGI